jgi:hypothetical protein
MSQKSLNRQQGRFYRPVWRLPAELSRHLVIVTVTGTWDSCLWDSVRLTFFAAGICLSVTVLSAIILCSNESGLASRLNVLLLLVRKTVRQ